MATIEQAAAVLAQAERRLRELVGRAAADGEYDVVDRITYSARAVATLTGSLESGEPHLHGEMSAPKAAAPRVDRGACAETCSTAEVAVSRRARRGARRPTRAPANGEYPKFFRRGGDLIKIGWSKKERGEYVHKAPRRVVDALAGAVALCASNGKVFTAEDLFPLKDPQDGGEFPGYQAYVVLAWFKSAELVEQHGRSGYSVRNGSFLPDAVNRAWQRLSEKSL